MSSRGRGRYFHEGHELHKEWVSLDKLVFLFLSWQGKLPLKNTKCTTATCSYASKKQKWPCCGLLIGSCPGLACKCLITCWSGSHRSCGKHQVLELPSVCPFKAAGTMVWRSRPLPCVLGTGWETEGWVDRDGVFPEVDNLQCCRDSATLAVCVIRDGLFVKYLLKQRR